MSPLAIILLRLLRGGALAAAGFCALAAGLELWKQSGDLSKSAGFLGLLAVMILGALWLARAITRELRQHGS